MGFINSNLEQLGSYAPLLDASMAHMISCAEHRDQLPASLQQTMMGPEDLAELHYIRDDLPEMLNDSIDGCRRVSEIVKSLKTFAHPDSGRLEPLRLGECIDIAVKITAGIKPN